MGQFVIAPPPERELPAVEVVVPECPRGPRVRRIVRCECPETRRLGSITYQFPDLDAALRWTATYCGPWGFAVRELVYDLREED